MKYCVVAILAIALTAVHAASTPNPSWVRISNMGVRGDGPPKGWVPSRIKGRVEDAQETGGNSLSENLDRRFLLLFGIDTSFDPEQYTALSWRRRVDRMPQPADISTRSGDDAAARLSVVFRDAADPFTKRKLEYVWGHYPRSRNHHLGPLFARFDESDGAGESGSGKLGWWCLKK